MGESDPESRTSPDNFADNSRHPGRFAPCRLSESVPSKLVAPGKPEDICGQLEPSMRVRGVYGWPEVVRDVPDEGFSVGSSTRATDVA